MAGSWLEQAGSCLEQAGSWLEQTWSWLEQTWSGRRLEHSGGSGLEHSGGSGPEHTWGRQHRRRHWGGKRRGESLVERGRYLSLVLDLPRRLPDFLECGDLWNQPRYVQDVTRGPPPVPLVGSLDQAVGKSCESAPESLVVRWVHYGEILLSGTWVSRRENPDADFQKSKRFIPKARDTQGKNKKCD